MVDTVTFNNILFRVMSGNLSFIFDRPIMCKTVKNMDQLDNSSWYYKVVLLPDWSVENMNPDITQYWM